MQPQTPAVLPTLGSAGNAYDIAHHQHLFAAWAASRAASTVKGFRFHVEKGRAILEASGFTAALAHPDQLPNGDTMDVRHRAWRAEAIAAASSIGLAFSHGLAAKLINCYCKSRFVCGGHEAHANVKHLHPPIDATLLRTLGQRNVGGFTKQWRRAHRASWSSFTSSQYEDVIALVRSSLNGEPLWKIEEYWQGNQ